MLRKKMLVYPIYIFFLLVFTTSCSTDESKNMIPISQAVSHSYSLEANEKDTLKFLILSTTSIKKTYQTYYELVSLLEEELGQPVQMIQKKTYEDALEAFEVGEADFGYVCGYLSVLGDEKGVTDKLVMPIVDGEKQYSSYLITRNNLDIDSLEDLEGRSFAFSDPASFSGYILPKHLIERDGKSIESYFSNTFYTYSHNHSIAAVAKGLADATSVYSTSYEKLRSENDPIIKQIKVIAEGSLVGNHPIVVNEKMGDENREKLRNAFYRMDRHEKGKRILEQLNIDYFIDIDENLYTSITTVVEQLGNQDE